MLIDLTVRTSHGDCDVRLDAPVDAPFGAARAELARAAGVPEDTTFYLDDIALADDTPVSETGLRTGSIVGVSPTTAFRATHPYSLRVTAGPAAGRVHPLHRGAMVIGRDAGCDITLDDERISRRHATLEVTAGRVTVLDHDSTNGSTVDGRPIPPTGTALDPGAVLQLGDSLLSVAAPSVRAADVSAGDGVLMVNRAPRLLRPGVVEVIAWPAEPARDRPHPVQWIAAMVPALAAAGLAWFTGSTLFLLFGLLSPALLLSTALGDRWHGRRLRRRTGAEHRAASHVAAQALRDALAAETEQRRVEFPDPAVLALMADTPGVDIWARRPADPDWLAVRVGCGSTAARTLVRDDGRDRPGGTVHAVPVVADLRTRPMGLAGPAEVRAAMARWWVAQLAVHHAPDDLALVVLARDDSWAWARWLPHARIVDTAGERAQVIEQLGADVAHRERRAHAGDAPSGSTVVLVVDGVAEPALSELVVRGAAVGVTAVWLRTEPGLLPDGCTTVVADADGRARLVDGALQEHDLVADTVTVEWAERAARALAPLVDVQARRAGRLPQHCTLTGLLGFAAADAAEIAQTWAASNGRADTVLGRTPDGALDVDLEADGPHALVAGTTGSGKSELLRTFVAGLCLRHPPDEVSVLLIDYKGGAAFAECAELPHCAGLVTDLDPHLTARALRSLDAEIRRREVLLRDAGVVDLPAYRAAGSVPPLARLVIVVDEFATLADELPDFVPGLIGVAQRGRSLGVHLVLATQRPGSVVSPEIRANTSLRIALRVTGAGESVDVVGTDDAAAIAPSTPGRAVMRDGSGLRVFQTARPAITAPATSRPRVTRLTAGEPRNVELDRALGGLDTIVSAVATAARDTGRAAASSPWLAPLPGLVSARTLPAAAFALADVPDQQRQPSMEVVLDPVTSMLLLGTTRSGRSTALAAIALAAARTHDVAEVELHVVDARGDLLALLHGLPHLSTALGPDELELVDTLLERLAGVASTRRRLLLVDGWDVVTSVLDDDAAVGTEQRLAALLRTSGPVSIVVTGDRSLLAPRFSGAFDRRLALRLGDRTDYGALGISARDLPVAFPPGRGVRADDGVEFQVAVPCPADGHVGVPAALRAAVDELSARAAVRPLVDRLRVRALPASVTIDELGPPAERLRIGLGGDDASPVTLDPYAGSRRWLVCGPPRSGRSGVLSVALTEAVRTACPVLVAAPPRSPVAELAKRLGVGLLDPADRAWNIPSADCSTLLLVDDTDAFLDTEVGDALLAWVRDTRARLAVLATGRPDDLALAYRGLAAEVRRSRSGIALRPGPIDGELFGVRLPRARGSDPPGSGRLIGDPAWAVGGAPVGDPIRIQVAAGLSPYGGSGDPYPTRTSP
ncbi:FtsK/SpoIIIE domain-containing protein [uncultured Jatrophihabitans sp.]|uniref:FtsK/SpoIIIE domain-containing protein n=1 Tax=uncultured Jatrophihabitans sp. TaxID=1610747 RepID=UPI0035CA544A